MAVPVTMSLMSNTVKLENARARILRVNEFVSTNPPDSCTTIPGKYKIRLDVVLTSYKDFAKYHDEITVYNLTNEVEPTVVASHTALGIEIEELVLDLREKLEAVVLSSNSEITSNQESQVVNSSAAGRAEIRLPPLSISSFDGNYNDWTSFYDLFLCSVHNNTSLRKVQKMQYLKSLLKDEALQLVRHLPVTDANYDIAFKKLETRYNKKDHLVQQLIKKFMEQPVMSETNYTKLRSLTNNSDEIIRSLTTLNQEGRDPWIIHILTSKLDSETRQIWATKVIEDKKTSLEDLFQFLENRCDAIESCQSQNTRNLPVKNQVAIKSHHVKVQSTKSSRKKPTGKSSILSSATSSSFESQESLQSPAQSLQAGSNQVISCSLCPGESHQLYQCKVFKGWNVISRRDYVRNKFICFNCLYRNHTAKECPMNFVCQTCKQRHHTLLHPDEPNKPTEIASTSSGVNSFHGTSDGSIVRGIVPTAVVNCQDGYNKLQPIRAIFDTGSEISFITESCVQQLGLTRENARLAVNGISKSDAGRTRGKTELRISSRFDANESATIDAYILVSLTSKMPQLPLNRRDWDFVDDLPLADPEFDKPKTVDVIIGSRKFFKLLRDGQVQGSRDNHLAQNTMFGYIMTGDQTLGVNESVNNFHLSLDLDLDKSMRRFWETEEIPTKLMLTPDEVKCEEHFAATHRRNENGRFVVKLPFKDPEFHVGENKFQSLQRMKAMERKFNLNSNFKRRYCDFIDEYMHLEHLEKVPEEEISGGKVHYLPHHAVIKESSSSTKLRVVFDASSRSDQGTTLNDHLLVGPTIQEDLFTTVVRFRTYQFAFTADIEKMYRQILVDKGDRDYQRIVWRSSEEEPMNHYRLNTVTYGTSSAPFLAMRCLQQLGKDNEEKFPEASKSIQQSFYVDDLMCGSQSLDKALLLQKEITHILSSGGFQLRKWAASHSELLETVPEDHREINIIDPDQELKSIKTLGLFWQCSNDIFSFQVNVSPVSSIINKRQILSDASRLFDPLGWLSPVIVNVKIFFQRLWLLDVTWDDELPPATVEEWRKLHTSLKLLEDITIPRWLPTDDNETQLHGFCDASESAFGAVIYIRTVIKGEVKVGVVTGKTKVSPIKQLSIPRLELCAAVLLTRLMKKINPIFENSNIKCFLWTDSTIVLSWLAAPPRRWQTFVANRTSEVVDSYPSKFWYHVPTEQNPADCASRGIPTEELISHRLWWSGPDWLSQSSEFWPSQHLSQKLQDCPEVKELKIVSNVVTQDVQQSDLVLRYSSLQQLIRISSFCLRFAHNCRNRNNKRTNHLTTNELNHTTNVFIRFMQENEYHDELRALGRQQPIPPSSKLKSLHPFIDGQGLLRVGGRLQNSSVPYSAQHPTILSGQDAFTKLLVQNTHIKYLHAGATLLTSILFQQYWIVGHRNLIKHTIHKCVTCFRNKAAVSSQLMGNLPSQRTTPSRPFSNVGVDFAGPILTKQIDGRGKKFQKSYIAVFVCMAVKAIHLEVVSDLSTKSFLNALKRFSSRRGRPSDIFSDNGTTFVGANRELKEFYNFLKDNTDSISHFLTDHGTNWHFIPPVAPNFGGLWEAGVKSVKFHLKRVLANTVLTYEELATVLATIEACLNSRPLCCGSTDPQSVQSLTPAHFLIGEPLTTIPEPNPGDITINRLNRWKFSQKLTIDFWNRWKKEYLSTLQTRNKWSQNMENLKINELVLIKEDNYPPAKWCMGRVTSIHPGTDGKVRVVSLWDGHREFKRSIQKLCKLPST